MKEKFPVTGEEERRRSFLKSAVSGIAVAIAAGLAAAGLSSLVPRSSTGRGAEFIPLVDEEEAPRRGAREFTYSFQRAGREMKGKVFLVLAPEGLIALSPSCTHLGCFVVWREREGDFLCPCHGGRYDIAGRNVEGPPPRPLARFPLRRDGGLIHVEVPV